MKDQVACGQRMLKELLIYVLIVKVRAVRISRIREVNVEELLVVLYFELSIFQAIGPKKMFCSKSVS
jgi:hypothetical protein